MQSSVALNSWCDVAKNYQWKLRVNIKTMNFALRAAHKREAAF